MRTSPGHGWHRLKALPLPAFRSLFAGGNTGGGLSVGGTNAPGKGNAGETWRVVQGTIWDVTYGNGRFVAVGQDGTILTSTDGVGWTRQESGTKAWLKGVTYGDGRFVAVGEWGTILTSTDGVRWTRQESGTKAGLNDVTHGDGRFVAVGGWGTFLGVGGWGTILVSP